MLRCLRITVSVISLVAGMLLIALWLRSSASADFYGVKSSSLFLQTGNGRISVQQEAHFFPYWIPVLLTGTLAAVLGIRSPIKFSLRTLLIAMTVIAAWLGLIASLI